MRHLIQKRRKFRDAETTLGEVGSHTMVNFCYGLATAMVILSLKLDIGWLIAVSFLFSKFIEGKILNREKYQTKFGKNLLFPLPSLAGFLAGWLATKVFF